MAESRYPLFFKACNVIYALVVESNKDSSIVSARVGIAPDSHSNFAVVGHSNDSRTLFNIYDSDTSAFFFSVIGYDRAGGLLHITIVPGTNGAVVAVNGERTTLMQNPPFIGQATDTVIKIQHFNVLGLKVLVSGITATKHVYLNGWTGIVCGAPKRIVTSHDAVYGVPTAFKVPVAFVRNGIASKMLIANKYLTDISF